MTKQEWYAAFSLYRNVVRLRTRWYNEYKAKGKVTMKLKDIEVLQAQIPSSKIGVLCDAHNNHYLRDGALHYRWRTAAYAAEPWFETQGLPYVTATHGTNFVLTCNLKHYAANVKKWRVRQYVPTLARLGDDSPDLAPTMEKCA